jgi:two-component system, LytTR family, response regulator
MREGKVLRVLVVDDEPLGRRRLLGLLKDEPDVEVIGHAADGAAAIEAIRTLRPDLVFLDVQLPRMTGVDVTRAIGSAAMPATIFVTAYDQHALHAFEYAAVDYLVKPFRDERFREALGRARRRIEAESRERLHEHLVALLQGAEGADAPSSAAAAPRPLERIAVQMKGRLRFIPVGQIDYITASGIYAELHVGPDRHVIRESMQDLEEKLEPDRFMRIHRSVIVRLDLVDTLLRREGSDYEVQLKDGTRLRVSRSRREELERRMGKVW